ncbi:MAG TPA: hypothetical protein VMR37_04475 [Rhabdochlamydiaceae bacterium]|jgi:hypothetical protein|nr:hypothetical protein [Rhabdochlamydiaceae bacterium]
MFEYRLPSTSWFSFFNPWRVAPLLTSIQIQGPFITIFGRKTVGEELHVVLKELKGRVIQGDDYEHYTIHDKVDDVLFSLNQQPHVHYTMPHKSIEQGITDLIIAIFQRQNPAVRAQEYRTLLAQVEEQRVKCRDTELPKFLQEKLAQIDIKSPFFLSQNSQKLIQDILSKYGKYCRRPSNDRCRELMQMYFMGPLFKTIIDKANMERIKPILQPLFTIEERLETARKEPLNTQILQQILGLIPQVNVNEVVKLESDSYVSERTSLQGRLDFIARYTHERINAVEAYKKTSLFRAYSFFNRISQVFHSIFRTQIPRTAGN